MRRNFICLCFLPMFLLACGANRSSNELQLNATPLETEQTEKPHKDTVEQEAQFCALDAKECPDGSYVSRDPLNNCEFKACPKPAGPDEKNK